MKRLSDNQVCDSLRVRPAGVILVSMMPFILLGGCAHQYQNTANYASPAVYTSMTMTPPTDYVALDQISIADHFNVVDVNDGNIDSALKQCLPTLPSHSTAAQRARDMMSKNNSTSVFAHAGSASRFILRAHSATCLQFSTARYPVFPAEMIDGTANPKGPAPEVLQDWDRQIATMIARKGEARVAYVFANGNAFGVRYYADQDDVVLHYPSQFLKAGTWESEYYDIKFNGDMTSFSTSERDHQALKRPLMPKIPQV